MPITNARQFTAIRCPSCNANLCESNSTKHGSTFGHLYYDGKGKPYFWHHFMTSTAFPKNISCRACGANVPLKED